MILQLSMEQTKPQPAAQGTKYKGSHLQSSYGEDFAPKVRAPLRSVPLRGAAPRSSGALGGRLTLARGAAGGLRRGGHVRHDGGDELRHRGHEPHSRVR